ncbi:MAG TPA: PIN domain-containing protein [Acidobacteriaceae bacterium]|nr:PIN domain-containing protein [Acidobacteriaceae bacterium]
MSRIYWDTMLFIYWMEGNPDYARRVKELDNSMKRRRDVLCTSTFALGEMLVKPYKLEKMDLVRAMRDYFQNSEIELLPFNAETAEVYARIRAEYDVSAADAIHLATAAQARVDLFLTNDRRLSQLTIPGIHFIAGLDTNLL